MTLVVHAPPVVHEVIERDLDDFRGRFAAARGVERSGEIDIVEAENHVRRRD